MLRDIGLAAMSVVLVSVIAATAAAIWWFRFRKRKTATVSEAEAGDQEKGEQPLKQVKENAETTEIKGRNILLRCVDRILGLLGKRKPDTTIRPASKSASLTTTVVSEDGQSTNRKKELRIETEIPPEPAPAEPWTPRGTNRRDEEDHRD